MAINQTPPEPSVAVETTPASVNSSWYEVCDTISTQDSATVTIPSGVTDYATRIITAPSHCTQVLLRCKYDDEVTSVTGQPKVKVFGRFNEGDNWMTLENKDGDIAIVLTVDTTNDVDPGDYRYTLVKETKHHIDLKGCNQFIVCVETALAATGTVSTATVEAKHL